MIFVAPDIYSQVLVPVKTPLPVAKMASNVVPAVLSINPLLRQVGSPKPFLSPGYYASQLGFFCKQEIKLEKTAKIPFKFRLGSVDDCDRMEGKFRSH
ncbi:hypothetical protein QWZ08_21340 [Ferruginibacter paludis]|uniref:hypothetical protein n=1 Tax=Ferruginibacter paludis TaxID=1310417 RepID=UPI0025B290F4|nr:hypothetical protein [Ferruginibacter paludis]MDN3658211.1 hypothetical protein [Ferruginibacter paludis]